MENSAKKKIQFLIGKRIREIREEKRISQVKLAQLCKFERSNMSRIESGNTNPTIFTLFLVAQGLGVGINQLTKEVDKKRKDRTI